MVSGKSLQFFLQKSRSRLIPSVSIIQLLIFPEIITTLIHCGYGSFLICHEIVFWDRKLYESAFNFRLLFLYQQDCEIAELLIIFSAHLYNRIRLHDVQRLEKISETRQEWKTKLSESSSNSLELLNLSFFFFILSTIILFISFLSISVKISKLYLILQLSMCFHNRGAIFNHLFILYPRLIFTKHAI